MSTLQITCKQGSFAWPKSQGFNAYRSFTHRIQNPLHGIPKNKLLRQVEQFAQERDMEDILPDLRKGALLAQNPKDFENIPELDEADREIIRQETTRQ